MNGQRVVEDGNTSNQIGGQKERVLKEMIRNRVI